jgi:hypothetical protein
MYKQDNLKHLLREAAFAVLRQLPGGSRPVTQSMHVLAIKLTVTVVDSSHSRVQDAKIRFIDTGLDYVRSHDRSQGTVVLGSTGADGSLSVEYDYNFCRIWETPMKRVDDGTFEVHVAKLGHSPVTIGLRMSGLKYDAASSRFLISLGTIVLPQRP